MEEINSSSLRYFRVKEEDRQDVSIIDIITIKGTIRIGIDQILEIGEPNLVEEFSMNKIIEVDQGINKLTGMMIREKILEVT